MIHLVYRSLWEGPTGKRVRHLEAPSLLAWFQGVWDRASSDPTAIDAICGRVYGFHTLFDREPILPPPTSVEELRERVETRLYVEGYDRYLDEHALRVKTDDDECDVAYFFFDDSFPAARTAWMLHEPFELPTDTGSGGFVPRVPVRSLEPGGSGEGATYAVLLTGYDSSTFDFEGPTAIAGVRLPELAGHLRGVEPAATITRLDESRRPTDPYARRFWSPIRVDTEWPRELLLLRSRLTGDTDLEGALRACNAFPTYRLMGKMLGDAGFGPVERAREAFDRHAEGQERPEEHAARSRFQISPHVAQMAMKLAWADAHHQWIFFDDLWASRHPDLANGLLEWASRWDVLDR